jgi:hypothetical protein
MPFPSRSLPWLRFVSNLGSHGRWSRPTRERDHTRSVCRPPATTSRHPRPRSGHRRIGETRVAFPVTACFALARRCLRPSQSAGTFSWTREVRHLSYQRQTPNMHVLLQRPGYFVSSGQVRSFSYRPCSDMPLSHVFFSDGAGPGLIAALNGFGMLDRPVSQVGLSCCQTVVAGGSYLPCVSSLPETKDNVLLSGSTAKSPLGFSPADIPGCKIFQG